MNTFHFQKQINGYEAICIDVVYDDSRKCYTTSTWRQDFPNTDWYQSGIIVWNNGISFRRLKAIVKKHYGKF